MPRVLGYANFRNLKKVILVTHIRSSLKILIRKQTADKKYLVECFFTSPVNFFSFGGFPHTTTHAGFITLRCHVSRAFKELCLLSEVFSLRSSTQPAPRDLAVPCATRGRGSWAYPTASCGLFREDCRRDRALSPVNLRVRPNFLALSPSSAGGIVHVRVSVSVERSKPSTVPPPRERIASHAIRAWYQGPYSSLTILSSPRAALPQTRASRHARNRNPPRTTTPHLKWDPRVWPPTATTRRPGRPNRPRASLSVMSRRLHLPIRRRARSPPRAPSPLVGIAGIAFSSTVALESKSRESPPTWNRPLSDPPPSRCPPPMRPPPRRRPKAAPAAADEQPGRTPHPRPPPQPTPPKGTAT